MRILDIPFRERFEAFVDHGSHEAFQCFSPTGRVPCLLDGETVVWDSLAILEYLAEIYPNVWPSDRVARAFARSAAAEMHSGFSALRNFCPMSCGVRIELTTYPTELRVDLDRLDKIWREGIGRFGGPFLAGDGFTGIDAFFAPIAFRLQTYGLSLSSVSDVYVDRLRRLPAMQEWYSASLAETVRESNHEAELLAAGRITADLRACT